MWFLQASLCAIWGYVWEERSWITDFRVYHSHFFLASKMQTKLSFKPLSKLLLSPFYQIVNLKIRVGLINWEGGLFSPLYYSYQGQSLKNKPLVQLNL
jgi:hypothetical protein